MAKAVVPPSKAPADKGHHVVLNFPVANVKEQSIKLELRGDSENLEASAAVIVSFETFSPTKRYEKVLELPDPVTLRQWSKNVSSKNLSIILLKASHAPPPSPKSSSVPFAAPPSPKLLPSVATPPIIKKEQPAKSDVMSKAAEKETPAEHSEDEEEQEHVEANGQEGPPAAGKKKKKNKPRKKGGKASKAADEEDDVQVVVDEAVAAATAEIERVSGKLQDARARLQNPKKELEAAEAQEAKAAQKAQQLEAEWLKWEAHYKAEIRKWQAEQKAAAARCEGCKDKLLEAQGLVESLEAEADRHRASLREAEAKAKEQARAAADREEEQRQELEREAQEEKKQEQEERRKRAEEERQRASEEKKRKEVERKQNAARREAERKQQEEEEERRKAERKGKAAPTGKLPDMKNFPGGMEKFKEMAELMKKDPAMLNEMMKQDPGMLDKLMKEQKSVKPPGAAPKPPQKEEPWRGPLIEEIEEVDPVPETSGKPPHRAADVRDAKAAAAAGWVVEEGQEGSSWMLDLAVPSIESLAEVNLDIGGDAILLTPVAGGAPVASCMVPTDANADEASAKWSKKKRTLTIRMPRVV